MGLAILFTSEGDAAAASAYGQAAKLAGQNAQQEKAAYNLQAVQTARAVEQTQGTAIADAADNGGMLSGSAGDIIRSNANQGNLAVQLVTTGGQIQVNSYLQQQQAYLAQQQAAEAAAKAAEAGAFGGIIGGAVGIIGGIASMA